jgi:hypothetical protein
VHTAFKKAGYCCNSLVDCEGAGQYSDLEKEHNSEKYLFAGAYRVKKLRNTKII